MSGPKPDALPLGDTPLHNFIYHSMDIWVGVKGVGILNSWRCLEGVWGVWGDVLIYMLRSAVFTAIDHYFYQGKTRR